MATLKLYQPVDMTKLQAWDGQFPIVEAGHIQATDGVRVQDYFGSFQFDANGLSGGTLTSTASYQNGLLYEVTGLNIDAMIMEGYIGDFNFAGALSEVLKGNDTVIGSAGNDVIISGAGNDTIDAGAGVDAVYYSGNKNTISVASNGTGYQVSANGNVDALINVERVNMGDGSVLALDVKAGENAGTAYRLYQAALDRKPDAEGLKFWTHQLDIGDSATQVAQGFVSSQEFKALNPGSDPASLVNSYYQNVLHRAADADGLAFWSDAMNNGMTSAQLLVAFSESQENISNTAADLNNGVWLV